MPTELIKCSKAVRIDTWKRSGSYTPVEWSKGQLAKKDSLRDFQLLGLSGC